MKRIEWIDIAKILGMILVIMGHTLTLAFPRGLIYSFHMPLFFALSMATFKFSSNKNDFIKKIKKGLLNLILPALITWIIILIILIAQTPSLTKDITWWEKMFLGFIYCAGYTQTGSKVFISGLPAIWFLISLFIGKIIIDGLNLIFKNKKVLIVISFAACLVGYLFGRLPTYLPFGLDIVMVCLPIFVFGTYLRKIDFRKKPILNMFLCLFLWLLTLALISTKTTSYRYMDLYHRNYPLFPLCLIPSIFGCLFFVYLCYFISLIKIKAIKVPLLTLGKNTLYLVCIHSIESKAFYDLYIKNFSNNQWILCLIRIGINLAALVIVLFFVWLLKRIIQRTKIDKNKLSTI